MPSARFNFTGTRTMLPVGDTSDSSIRAVPLGAMTRGFGSLVGSGVGSVTLAAGGRASLWWLTVIR